MSVQIPSSLILQPKEVGAKDPYLTALLEQVQGQKLEFADWLQEVRDRATSWVEQQRMPSKRDEEWRSTDLSSLMQVNFVKAQAQAKDEVPTLPEAAQSRVVFVNGVYSPKLSDVSALPEAVFVGNLAQLPDTHLPEIVKYLAQQEGGQEVFTALNTAGFADVAVIWAAANVTVETPIHLVFLSVAGDSPTFSQPRALVVAKRGSSLELIEHYLGAQTYFTNAVTEVWLEENAQVQHTRVQQESESGFHIGKTAIAQARSCRYTCNAISLGAKLSRHNLEVWQRGEQTETTLNGLTMIGGNQLADTHSAIALTKPYGTTDQLHKCIVDDRAHAVFNGKVFVPKAAQLTNAAQLNRNLLLSPKARIDTKPELQITADNVKCSHGATISQLEPEEIFYLRSRGLNEADARQLLIDAFTAEIIDRLSVASLRDTLSESVARTLN